MSNIAHRAFALVASEPNFEGLTKRLLALRAEIDAILTELAGQATAMPQAEAASVVGPAWALAPAAEAPIATAAQDLLPVPSDTPADGESRRESCGVVEGAQATVEPSAADNETGRLLQPSEMVCAAAPEQPITDPVAVEPIECGQDACEAEEPAPDAPVSITAIDADPAERTDDASLFREAEVSPAADKPSATEAAPAEQQGAAEMLEAPQQPAPESIAIEEHQEPAALVDAVASSADGPQAGDGPVTAAIAASEAPAPADAVVISIHARQRKQKGGIASGAPIPARTGRRLAAKIAACILVLLTAATVLGIADRNAFGSVQSLPWISPAPSGPTGIDWLLQRVRAIAAKTSDDAAGADPALDDGPLAGRMGWGS